MTPSPPHHTATHTFTVNSAHECVRRGDRRTANCTTRTHAHAAHARPKQRRALACKQWVHNIVCMQKDEAPNAFAVAVLRQRTVNTHRIRPIYVWLVMGANARARERPIHVTPPLDDGTRLEWLYIKLMSKSMHELYTCP